MLSRTFRSSLRVLPSVRGSVVRRMGGGGDHHGPMMPPFARIRPPTETIHEEIELVWDDSVAPETALDFDALHVPASTAISMWALGMGFFAALYLLIRLSDVPSRSPVASRIHVLSAQGLLYDMGESDDPGDEEEH